MDEWPACSLDRTVSSLGTTWLTKLRSPNSVRNDLKFWADNEVGTGCGHSKGRNLVSIISSFAQYGLLPFTCLPLHWHKSSLITKLRVWSTLPAPFLRVSEEVNRCLHFEFDHSCQQSLCKKASDSYTSHEQQSDCPLYSFHCFSFSSLYTTTKIDWVWRVCTTSEELTNNPGFILSRSTGSQWVPPRPDWHWLAFF